jgi:hypothetical protein
MAATKCGKCGRWVHIMKLTHEETCRGTGKCGTTYLSRDGGSTLVCTEKVNHRGTHYAGGPGA